MASTEIIPIGENLGFAAEDAVYAILIMSGHDLGRVVRLSRSSLTIGRSSSCDLRIGDGRDGTSRRHAQLLLEDGNLLIRDLGSKNGLILNREHVQGGERFLAKNDRIRIGKTLLKVVMDIRELSFFEGMYQMALDAAAVAALRSDF